MTFLIVLSTVEARDCEVVRCELHKLSYIKTQNYRCVRGRVPFIQESCIFADRERRNKQNTRPWILSLVF